MLIEKMNAIFPLSHSIFFQPFPLFSPNDHITTELNGTIMITFSMHSVNQLPLSVHCLPDTPAAHNITQRIHPQIPVQ